MLHCVHGIKLIEIKSWEKRRRAPRDTRQALRLDPSTEYLSQSKTKLTWRVITLASGLVSRKQSNPRWELNTTLPSHFSINISPKSTWSIIQDAAPVTRLRKAGAIIFGKTTMHELGMGTSGINKPFGTPRNPYDTSKYPGGSSSGSAAAVASGCKTSYLYYLSMCKYFFLLARITSFSGPFVNRVWRRRIHPGAK